MTLLEQLRAAYDKAQQYKKATEVLLFLRRVPDTDVDNLYLLLSLSGCRAKAFGEGARFEFLLPANIQIPRVSWLAILDRTKATASVVDLKLLGLLIDHYDQQEDTNEPATNVAG